MAEIELPQYDEGYDVSVILLDVTSIPVELQVDDVPTLTVNIFGTDLEITGAIGSDPGEVTFTVPPELTATPGTFSARWTVVRGPLIKSYPATTQRYSILIRPSV